MNILGGLLTVGGIVACCATLWVLFLVVLVIWYWRNQPKQQVSDTAPEPPIQATIEHPTVASGTESAVAPLPADDTTPAAGPDAAPPSADA